MTEISALLSKYSVKGILIDTNILLLYLIGLVNRDRIPLCILLKINILF